MIEKYYQKSSAIVSRNIADECILVPIRNNAGDLESIYTLNEAGARIWQLIDGQRSLCDIKKIIVEEFEVDPQQAEEDLLELTNNLLSIKAIE